MTRALRLALPLLIACALAPWPARADDAIDSDRPDVTDGPRTLERGRVQVEAGASELRDHGRGTLTLGEGLLRWGVADGFELRLDVPTWVAPPASSAGGRGLGDAGAGFKWRLPGATDAFAAGIVADVTVPTGHTGVGAGEAGGEAVLALDHELGGRFGVSANVGGAREDGEDALLVSVSLECALSARTSTWAEWAGSRAQGAFAHLFDTGLTWQCARAVQLDLHAGVGAGQSSGQSQFGAGVTRRW